MPSSTDPGDNALAASTLDLFSRSINTFVQFKHFVDAPSYLSKLMGHKQSAANKLRRSMLNALMTLTARSTKLGKAC